MIEYLHKAMKRRVVKYIVLQRAQYGEIGYRYFNEKRLGVVH